MLILAELSDEEKAYAKEIIRNNWNSDAIEYQKRHRRSTDYVHYGPGCPNDEDIHLLGNVEGKKVIELGCGGGQNCIALAKKGAVCFGIDFSEEQIEYARKLARKNKVNISFVVGDIENLNMVEDESQDIAISAFAFCCVQNLDRTFKETYCILKKGGIFVLSLGHPFYNIFWGTGDHFDEEFKVQRSYFLRVEVGDGVKCSSYTIENLVNGLIDSGFILQRILEPDPVEDKFGDYSKDYSHERLKLIPGTIIFKALKT